MITAIVACLITAIVFLTLGFVFGVRYPLSWRGERAFAAAHALNAASCDGPELARRSWTTAGRTASAAGRPVVASAWEDLGVERREAVERLTAACVATINEDADVRLRLVKIAAAAPPKTRAWP